jgi:hypothetical protein
VQGIRRKIANGVFGGRPLRGFWRTAVLDNSIGSNTQKPGRGFQSSAGISKCIGVEKEWNCRLSMHDVRPHQPLTSLGLAMQSENHGRLLGDAICEFIAEPNLHGST